MSLPSWELLSEPELLQAWAMNLMVINVSTRKYAPAGRCGRRSAGGMTQPRMALTRSKLKAWLASPLDDLDLVVLQIDGLHVGDHLMVAAIGIDTGGAKHVLGRRPCSTTCRARSRSRTASALHRRREAL